jgi:thiol-disulfide isomerase/thioredoxin
MKRWEDSSTRKFELQRWASVGIIVLLAVLIGGAERPATAQSAAGSLRDFSPFRNYVLVVDGAEAPDAKIYFSETARAFLVFDEHFPNPVLIQPRKTSVETVQPSKVAEREGGMIDLLPAPTFALQKKFVLVGDSIAFTVDGTRATLKPRAALLGLQTRATLAAHDPEFARRALAYVPSEATLVKLMAEQEDVRVRVYLGTWCPHCQEAVPRVMKVDERLKGSRIRFEYYGLPYKFSKDPETSRAKITHVPTAVVFRGGWEIGRLAGNAWKTPELALNMMLLR